MEIKPQHSGRFERALKEADLEYMEGFTKYFPEAKTGDFPPDLTFSRDAHNREDMLWWLHYNAPELLVEE